MDSSPIRFGFRASSKVIRYGANRAFINDFMCSKRPTSKFIILTDSSFLLLTGLTFSKYIDLIDFYLSPLWVRCVMVCKTTRMEKKSFQLKKKRGWWSIILGWFKQRFNLSTCHSQIKEREIHVKAKNNKLKAIWRFLSYSFSFFRQHVIRLQKRRNNSNNKQNKTEHK